MIEIMAKDDGTITTGQLRKILADAMLLVMNPKDSEGRYHNIKTKDIISLAIQINKTLELESKQQAFCLKCKHKLNENYRP